MALPAHNPTEWNELLSSTMHNVRGTYTDNIFKKNPLLEHLLSAGRVSIKDGGYEIVEPLLYAEGEADVYGEWEVIKVHPTEALTAAAYEWKQWYSTIIISGLEEAQNNGKEQRINLLETKIKQSEMTMRSKMAKMLYGTYVSATPANDWISLDTAIDNTTAVGGIDPATETWWKSYEAVVGSVDAAGLETAMRTAVMSTSDNGGDAVDAIFTDPATYAFYESTLTPQVRYTDTDKANLGFRNLLFENAPVMWDAECPAGTMYGINSEYIGIAIHKDRNFTQSPFTDNLSGSVRGVSGGGAAGVATAEAIDARVSFITTYGNLTVRNRRRLFKLTGIVKAP
jgi:hypothetical protein